MAPLRILVVCTGNLCRSVLAAELLSSALAGGPVPTEVRSAGTAPAIGARVPDALLQSVPPLAATSRNRILAHRPAPIDPVIVRAADLVLTATREHRRAVVSLVPAVTRRTFTLREFARVVGESDPADRAATGGAGAGAAGSRDLETLRRRIAEAAAARGTVSRPDDPSDDDVVDPFGRSADVYAAAADRIRECVGSVVRFVEQ